MSSQNFNLDQYLEGVYGCDDGKSKTELVEELLEVEGLSKLETVMIGDRSYDIEAGKKNGVRTIGVLWGYGSRQELEEAGADSIVSTVKILREVIMPNKASEATAESRASSKRYALTYNRPDHEL